MCLSDDCRLETALLRLHASASDSKDCSLAWSSTEVCSPPCSHGNLKEVDLTDGDLQWVLPTVGVGGLMESFLCSIPLTYSWLSDSDRQSWEGWCPEGMEPLSSSLERCLNLHMVVPSRQSNVPFRMPRAENHQPWGHSKPAASVWTSSECMSVEEGTRHEGEVDREEDSSGMGTACLCAGGAEWRKRMAQESARCLLTSEFSWEVQWESDRVDTAQLWKLITGDPWKCGCLQTTLRGNRVQRTLFPFLSFSTSSFFFFWILLENHFITLSMHSVRYTCTFYVLMEKTLKTWVLWIVINTPFSTFSSSSSSL